MAKLADSSSYRGREHAQVKHHLLKTYIERFLMILGQHAQRLVYVDAFSGPWKSSSDGHADTSFGLAWQTAVGCSEALGLMNHRPSIRQLWIEADERCYSQLKAFADSCVAANVSVETLCGRFEEKVDEIVSRIGNDYAFVLVDPLGYKRLIEPEVLQPLLALPRAELMINYMWQFINYAAKQDKQAGNRANLLRIFGERFDEISSIVDQGERERALLEEYELRLRSAGAGVGARRTRVMSFPIRYATNERTKYYLVYVTHSAKGLITFAETSERAAEKQKEVFYLTHERLGVERTGTSELFPGMAEIKPPPVEPLVGAWLELLPAAGHEIVIDEEVWATLLEKWRCRPSALQKGLQLLQQQGTISNLDAGSSRRLKHFVHYDKAERLRRLK